MDGSINEARKLLETFSNSTVSGPMRRRPCGHVVFFVAVSVSVGLCGCAIVRSTSSAKGAAADTAFVRSVDFNQAPELKDLAERARQIGN